MSPLPEDLRQQIERLVREILAGALPGVIATPPPPPRRACTFVFTGAERGLGDALDLLDQVRSAAPVEVVASPCYLSRHGDAEFHKRQLTPLTKLPGEELHALLRRSGAVVFPHPTRTTIAKVATGITDSLATALMTQTLLSGVPCLSGLGDCDATTWPATTPGSMRSGPRSLGEIMRQHLDTLALWGLQVKRGGELLRAIEAAMKDAPAPQTEVGLAPALAPPKKPQVRQFVTATDIRAFARTGGKILETGPLDIITQEARDVAGQLGIALRP